MCYAYVARHRKWGPGASGEGQKESERGGAEKHSLESGELGTTPGRQGQGLGGDSAGDSAARHSAQHSPTPPRISKKE